MACWPIGFLISQCRSLVSFGSACRRELTPRTPSFSRSISIMCNCSSDFLASASRGAISVATPIVDGLRCRFPDLRLIGAGQMRDGAEFGRHRHPIVGLGEDGMLAGDGIAHHGEAVMGSDTEGVKAVHVLDAVFERLLEGDALAQFPRHIGGGDFSIVLGLEFEAFALEIFAQAIVVR